AARGAPGRGPGPRRGRQPAGPLPHRRDRPDRHRGRPGVRRGAHGLARRAAPPPPGRPRQHVRHPRRVVGRRHPRRDRHAAGAPGPDRHRLHRRRRRHVHLPGAVDRGPARRRGPLRRVQQPPLRAAEPQHRPVPARHRRDRSAAAPRGVRPVPPGDRLRRAGQGAGGGRRRRPRAGRRGGRRDGDARRRGSLPRRGRHRRPRGRGV
ncbi:MAG: COG0028: Thiamine pyrophosphate-requiring enzymes [acetolactate synthase, pyruvate dehydrogenase (cytochrome), glyoxylate carboligase, phosphonopyruvate decarboxylase], partial [uncultured Pseudonocardia sp.]